LDRQKQAVPRSHGNYYHSLKAAKKLIEKEIQEGGGDVDPEDQTSVALIFLSDGKPSDENPQHLNLQKSTVSALANQLKDNFSFHAIGLGRSGADFGALKSLTKCVQARGCNATFSVSDLSCIQLGDAFSAVGTTVTAPRAAKTDTGGFRALRELKNVRIRSKSVPHHARRFQQYTTNTTRWTYNHDKYLNKDAWPWNKTKFKNATAKGFDLERDPFGRGAERLAFTFFETGKHGRRVGKAMVAKETTYIDYDEERKITFHETFCRVQHVANTLAQQFNKAVQRSARLMPIHENLKTPDIRFLDCCVYEYPSPDGTTGGVLVEEFLAGKFIKYNSNAGYVRRPPASESTLQLAIGTVYMSDFLQAFSHWVYVHTDHRLLVCDLQGRLNEEARHPKFDLTDPCICSKGGGRHGRKDYGATNLGARGFRAFIQSHCCNDVCKGLGLPPFGMRSKPS